VKSACPCSKKGGSHFSGFPLGSSVVITAAQWKEILPGWDDPNAKGFITALFKLGGSQMCTKVVPSDENIRAITSFVPPN